MEATYKKNCDKMAFSDTCSEKWSKDTLLSGDPLQYLQSI